MLSAMQVKLKPWPWSVRWELHKYFNGIVPLTEADMPPKRWKRSLNPQNVKEWEKHDLMKQYRSNINEVEERQVASEVVGEMRTIDSQRLQQQRDRLKAAKPAAAAPTAKKSWTWCLLSVFIFSVLWIKSVLFNWSVNHALFGFFAQLLLLVAK